MENVARQFNSNATGSRCQKEPRAIGTSRTTQMKFLPTKNGVYQLVSDDGRLSLGRHTKDAGQNEAFYYLAWCGRSYGSVPAQESLTHGPAVMRVTIALSELCRVISQSQGSLPDFVLDTRGQAEFLDALGEAICEFNRVREGPFAEKLRMTFEAEIIMPSGSTRFYRST